MRIDIQKAAEILASKDNILILTHAHPDGDTLGSGYGLCLALLELGKNARVINADEIPKKYSYFIDTVEVRDFKEDYVVSVDVATEYLLGDLENTYAGKIDLCIDHHGTNTEYANYLLLDDNAASCAEIIVKVVTALNVKISKQIANCLYTGITTDTGCFRYSSVTADTYRVAGELVECGAENGFINRVMFETKTKSYARLERLALDSMEFFCDERVAVITLTQDMYKKTGSCDQETEALTPITRQIEGVEIGLTIREKGDGTSQASIRTHESVNAASLAKEFGGGGHPQAAACRFTESVDEVKKMIVEKCGDFLK